MQLIDFADSLHGCLFATNGHFMVTSDGGASWHLDSVHVSGTVRALTLVSDSCIWISSLGLYGSVDRYCRTIDAGKTWIERFNPDSEYYPCNTTSFFDSLTVLLVGDSNIFISTDGALTWRAKPAEWPWGVNSASFTDTLHGTVAFGNPSSPGFTCEGGFATTHDGAVSWDDSVSAVNAVYTDVHYFDGVLGFLRGYSVDYEGILLSRYCIYTNDGGLSWIGANNTYTILFGATYQGGLVLQFETISGVTFHDRDSTYTIPRDPYASERVAAFETISEDHAWVLSNEGRLFKRTGKATSVDQDATAPIPAQTQLYQNYPNPFNPSTKIRYSLPRNTQVSLSIHDLLGRQIASLVSAFQVAGEHEIDFDASLLPTATYFIRLTVDGASMTRKAVLIR